MVTVTVNLVDGAHRSIGGLGTVGPLAFGCWRFVNMTVAAAQQRIEAALEADMNLIDTADIYGLDPDGNGFGGAEELLGRVLAAAPDLRDRMVLATKGGIIPRAPYDQSPEYLRQACEASLRRLQVDMIDLYQIHRPDLFAHPESVAETLNSLREEGKIREVGVSNFTVAQYESLARYLPFSLVTIQPQFSANHVDPLFDGTFDAAMRDGVLPLAWSPLAGGRLATGDRGDDGTPRPELMTVIDEIAEGQGVGRDAVALAFVLAHPSRPVAIIGTQNLDRIARAPDALSVTLDRRDAYNIIEASTGRRLP